MKSFGKILREKRISLNRTIKQCADETKISKRFIEGLEEENIEIFPGKAYFTGFLRVYSEYLGLNPEELVEIYKKQSKIEQPIPYDELTKPLRQGLPKSAIIFMVVILGILIISSITYFLITNPKKNKINLTKLDKKVEQKKSQTINNIYTDFYKFTERKVLRNFKINEGFTFVSTNDINMHFKIIDINVLNKKVKLSFIELNKILDLPVKNQIAFDFNSDGINDFNITIENISNNGVVIDMERVTTVIPIDKSNFSNYSLKDLNKETQKINILITSRGYSYIKYISDDKEEKEILLKPDSTLRIEGKSTVELHISNLKSISFKINDKLIKLPDQILGFFVIKWVYNEELEKYQLVFNSRK